MRFGLLLLIIFLSGCSFQEEKALDVETVQKEIVYGGIGERIKADSTVYNIEKVESYTEIGETAVSKKTDGKFYLIYLNVENKGEKEYFFSPRMGLIDENSRRYSPDLKASFYLSNIIKWDKVLPPGGLHNGVIVFEVLNDVNKFELEIKDDWENVDRIYIPITESSVVFKGISEDVINARESNKLLKAGIN